MTPRDKGEIVVYNIHPCLISQNSQENLCARVSFLITLQASGLDDSFCLLLKKHYLPLEPGLRKWVIKLKLREKMFFDVRNEHLD